MNFDISKDFIDPQIINKDSYNNNNNNNTPFENVSKTSLFNYIVIIIIFLTIFSKLTIGLNIVFGLTLAVIVIMYLNKEEIKKVNDFNDIQQSKKDTMRPNSELIKKCGKTPHWSTLREVRLPAD